MSLEELVLKFCASLDNHADALRTHGGSGSTAVADKPADAPKRGRPRKEESADAGPTHDDALAVAKKLAAKEDKGVVSKLVRKHGGEGGKVVDLPKDKIAAFIAAAEVMLNESDDDTDDDEI